MKQHSPEQRQTYIYPTTATVCPPILCDSLSNLNIYKKGHCDDRPHIGRRSRWHSAGKSGCIMVNLMVGTHTAVRSSSATMDIILLIFHISCPLHSIFFGLVGVICAKDFQTYLW